MLTESEKQEKLSNRNKRIKKNNGYKEKGRDQFKEDMKYEEVCLPGLRLRP